MIKAYHKIIVILLVLWCSQSSAQVVEWFNRKATDVIDPSSVIFNIDYTKQHIRDSIKLRVTDIKDIQVIIDSKLTQKVYGVEVINGNKPDLAPVLSLLTKFPNLRYLKISDSSLGSLFAEPYQLPANISALKQLQGFEFAYTDKIDMDNAVKQLLSLKHLQTLAFREYPFPLPPRILQFKHLDKMTLGSQNIGDYNLTDANWTSVNITGGDMRERELFPSFKYNSPDRALLQISQIKALRTLTIRLKTLADYSVLPSFRQITGLSITGSLILSDSLIKEIGRLHTTLQQLSINMAGRDSLNLNGLRTMTSLKSLTLKFFERNRPVISSLATINRFKKLETLYISHSKPDGLPDIFDEMPLLKNVTLSDNRISTLPDKLFNLPALEYLDLSSNDLKSLPDPNRFGWPKLKTLDLNTNHLTDIPAAIINLPQLQNIDLSDNQIKTVPGGWENLQQLTKVNLSFNQLRQFPGGLQDNRNVEWIKIDHNAITAIHEPTASNYKLKNLTINDNKIPALPEHLGKYTLLETLQAENLLLKSPLPASLFNCRNLKALYLYNSIKVPTTLPDGFKKLNKLNSLNLGANPLIDKNSIFDLIFALQNERLYLDLTFDDLGELPNTKKWRKVQLGSLILAVNGLKTFPPEFANIKTTYGVQLWGNLFEWRKDELGINITNNADMKLMYDELNIPLPQNFHASNSAYATALTKQIADLYYKKNWTKVVEYADKAIKADSTAFAKRAHLYLPVGEAKAQIKDHYGAIRDLKQYFDDNAKKKNPDRYTLNTKEILANEYLAVNQPAEAVKIYAEVGLPEQFAKALKICKENKSEQLYRQLIDTTISEWKKAMATYSIDHINTQRGIFYEKGHYTPDMLIDYAFILLMANQPKKALEMLAKPKLPNKDHSDFPPMIAIITATANYLINPLSFKSVKNQLTEEIALRGKIKYQGYAPFETWLPYSNFTAKQQEDLMALQAIAK